jgi:hypothetical protein
MAGALRWSRTLRHAFALLLSTAIGLSGSAQDPVYDADEVKAAFLYHFGTYVQWPDAAPGAPAMTIAVLDHAAVAGQLARFLPGRRIQGREVAVVEITGIEELGSAEILFIGGGQSARLTGLIAALQGRPTLIVTDTDDGLERGAMVNFRLVDSRVRFEISVARAEQAGLMLSSRLLSAAWRVEMAGCCAGDPAPVAAARRRR